MQPAQPVKLTIPNNLDYLPPVLAFLREFASDIGFGKEEINKIELALEEAITNVIRHSLPRDQAASFELEMQPLTIGIELCIHDMGRPFGEKVITQFDPRKLAVDQEVKGLGNFLIQKVMDVVEYQSLGNKGKKLRMVKYFENPPAEYDVKKSNPWYLPEESGPPVAEVNFTIRRFIPSDAPALAELAYDTYGYSYLYENVYYPDRTIALNKINEIISVVAVTEEGILAGHTGLFCNPAYPGVAELAMAMVKPEYRGYHLFDKTSVLCVSTALDLKLNALFSQAVTLHTRSQPGLKKIGLLPVGILLAYFTAPECKGIENLTHDRVSPLVVFKLLAPYHAGTLYLPGRHCEFISGLLSSVSVGWENGEQFDTGKTKSVYSIQVNEVSSYARMFVYETGHDLVMELKQYLYRLRKEKLLLGELMLNLEDPLNTLLYEEIESLGFIFTGILPATIRGNFLTLVYLNGINANFDNIELIEDYGQGLLAYIRKDYEGRFF